MCVNDTEDQNAAQLIEDCSLGLPLKHIVWDFDFY